MYDLITELKLIRDKNRHNPWTFKLLDEAVTELVNNQITMAEDSEYIIKLEGLLHFRVTGDVQ